MRKGILALVGLAALLALPVVASGGTQTLATGDDAAQRVGPNFRINFTLKSRGGDPVAIKRLRFRRLRAECNGGAVVRVRGRFRHIDVNNQRRFVRMYRRNGKRVRIKGRVSANLQRVRGTIRARGGFGQQTGCDSRTQRWRAGKA